MATPDTTNQRRATRIPAQRSPGLVCVCCVGDVGCCQSPAIPPRIEFRRVCINRPDFAVEDPRDWQPLAPLPAADGCDITPQVGSNLFPRFQAPPSRVGKGIWPRYRPTDIGGGLPFDRSLSYRLFPGPRWGADAPFAPLCRSLPGFARCLGRILPAQYAATRDQV